MSPGGRHSALIPGGGADGGRPRPVFLLARGNVLKPVREVGPGALSCVQGLPSRFDLPAGHPEGDRRAALARWLTDPANPLTWRSIVNRIWQYHFGRGLVDTPNDFGHMGAPPSHQELLDWLAVEFRDGGQSFKQLHRLIVNSATYRQASVAPESLRSTAMAIDADNRLLWRQNRRKSSNRTHYGAMSGGVSANTDWQLGQRWSCCWWCCSSWQGRCSGM